MDYLLHKTASLERPFLEGLTTHELIGLADSFGIDIPPDLERVFIIAELLAITEDISSLSPGGKLEEDALVETPIPEPVPLPKQYNITFIEVMIRDPLWAFTFWEIKNADRELHEKAANFGGYHLRVCPLAQKEEKSGTEAPFLIPVGVGDAAWYLGFPPEGGRFKVDLCALRGGQTLALAASRPFTLPKLCNPPHARRKGDESNPLIQLSGLEDFQVIRNGDRWSRNK